MRFSATLALCAAPLALAGSLQVDLMKRGAVGVEVSERTNSESKKGSDNSVQISQASTSVTEIIVIWVNNGGGATTSSVNSASKVESTAAAAATHTVTVGGGTNLVYTPDTLNAAVGDMVIFTFMNANHTATQSAFSTPCQALAGGMDSGFMPNVNNTVSPPPQMAVQVTVATPLWFYCKQKGHCGKGMTFSINPTANKTQAMFQQMAIAQNGTGTAGAITGGTSSSAPAAAAPPAASTASVAPAASSSSASSGSMISGTGTTSSGGACTCACLCGVAAFPQAAVQGIGAFGGMSGAMPMAALAV